MDTRRLELGQVAALDAESFGEPGQRTFRLFAQTGEGRVSLWLEKEQMVMLGSAIDELLERVPSTIERPIPPPLEATFVGDLDVRLGSLALGYSEEIGSFLVEARDFSAAFELETITLVATRDQLCHVGEQIEEIVARSRPRCLLCGMPLTGEPHFCPESNGHAELSAPN